MTKNFLGTIGYIKSMEMIKGTVDNSWGPGNIDSVNNYIQNGLILHLDGIKNTRNGHNSESLLWENLINNSDFKDGVLKGGTSWMDDSLYIDGQNGSGVLFDLVKDFENITVEVVFKYDEITHVTNTLLIGNTQGAGVGIGDIDPNYFGTWWATGQGIYNLYPIQPTINNNKTYLAFSSGPDIYKVYNHNLDIFFTDALSLYESPAPWAVGANPATDGSLTAALKGQIYSIRVYNRQLSDEEIQFNRSIDNTRFNLISYTINYGSSTDNYVQTGLDVHYDGINNTGTGHSTNPSSWKNLATNSLDGTKVGSPTFDENSVILNGTNQYIRVGYYEPDYITIEQVLKFTSIPEGRAVVLGNFEGGGYGYYPLNDKWEFMIHAGGTGYEELVLDDSVNVNEIFTSSATYNGSTMYLTTDKYGQKKVNVEGKIKQPARRTHTVLGVNPVTTTTANTDWFPGHIYSTRLYSRALNDIEIQYNRRIDKERFNL